MIHFSHVLQEFAYITSSRALRRAVEACVDLVMHATIQGLGRTRKPMYRNCFLRCILPLAACWRRGHVYFLLLFGRSNVTQDAHIGFLRPYPLESIGRCFTMPRAPVGEAIYRLLPYWVVFCYLVNSCPIFLSIVDETIVCLTGNGGLLGT